jgi:hypothetical protein
MTTATDAQAVELFIVDAHRDDGRRFVVRSDELLTAFMELEQATRNGSPPALEHLLTCSTPHAANDSVGGPLPQIDSVNVGANVLI